MAPRTIYPKPDPPAFAEGLHLSRVIVEYENELIAQSESSSYRCRNSRLLVIIGPQPVDDHFYVVGLESIHLHIGFNVHHYPIYPHLGKTLLACLLKQLAVVTFSTLTRGAGMVIFFFLFL